MRGVSRPRVRRRRTYPTPEPRVRGWYSEEVASTPTTSPEPEGESGSSPRLPPLREEGWKDG